MYTFEEHKFDVQSKLDASLFGAFSGSGIVDFVLKIDRTQISEDHDIDSVKMVIHADGWNSQITEYRSYQLEQLANTKVTAYHIKLDFSALLKSFKLDGEGLFYYHYAVTFAGEDHIDEVIYLGGEEPISLYKLENFVGERQLLLYKDGYKTSKSFSEGVVYHIFVDRFASSGKCELKERAEFDKDWDNGIPQYAEYPGADVANNVFFGGDLWGVAEKIEYIASLGVKTIYLSPIFEAYSNHKYDTSDYLAVDSMFGGDEALINLCNVAKEHGIDVILDGVFNHTGADSIYFNKFNTYESIGAYQSMESQYYPWYSFRKFPDDYECWWGVTILPRLRSDKKEVSDFICKAVVPKWMNAGVSGWRLDVADELAESFLDDFRKTVKKQNSDAVVIGEVWEDASDKVSYNRRRRYLRGDQLDSVMNYPLRNAIINYVKYGACEELRRTTEISYRRYPKQSSDNLMNFLGTHDTERILTILGGADAGERQNAELAVMRMTYDERKLAIQRLKLAYSILAGLPGVPCVFYGDEAGMEGYRDPFCRRPFPWKNIENELLEHYRSIGQIRRENKVFRGGLFRLISLTSEHIVYLRTHYDECCDPIIVAACRSGELSLKLPKNTVELLSNSMTENITLREGETGYYLCRGVGNISTDDLKIL